MHLPKNGELGAPTALLWEKTGKKRTTREDGEKSKNVGGDDLGLHAASNTKNGGATEACEVKKRGVAPSKKKQPLTHPVQKAMGLYMD